MPANTSPDNIQFPVAGDQVAPLNTVFQNLAQTAQTALTRRVVANVADFTALAALSTTGKLAGDLAFVVEGAVYMSWSGTVWRQVTTATFASTDARDTAYAKAGAVYRVANVEALITSDGSTFTWSGSAWQLSGGAFPSYRQSLAATFTAAATNSQQEVTGLRIDAVGAPAGRYLFQAHLSVGDTAANEGEVRFRIDEVSINAGEPNRATAATISPYDLGDVFTFGGGTLRVRVFVSRTAGTRTILSAGRSFVSATYLGPS